MEEVVNLAALEGSIDFSMFGMFLKSDWVVKLVIIFSCHFLHSIMENYYSKDFAYK